ncbi:hypothetical protein [Endozoicomonas ascidiicola]|uniref:hypothetical protein n=1 Tax=Endozoicomonas ascidiicola TaxID=1698521 RepID=UPI000835C7A5|nr:hypothetical protein [Endozoicomonas ascidiicola]
MPKKSAQAVADYLLAVKGNQPTLYDDIKLFLNDLTSRDTLPEHVDYNETLEKGHGRIEIRRCWVSSRLDWLVQKKDWVSAQPE